MRDIEKGSVQRDARRTVAGRLSAVSSTANQAIIRHLGVELYKERRHTEPPQEQSGDNDRTDGPDRSMTSDA